MKKWTLFALCMSCSLLQAEVKVLAFAGSTREASLNKALIKEAGSIAGSMGASVKIIDLNDFPLPFFNQDIEAAQGKPLPAQQLRQLMIQSDVIFIASPEYNGSVSAILKNALDWISRSEPNDPAREALNGKKFVLLSASPGRGGGARGLVHLKTIVEDIKGKVFPQQFSLGSASRAFDSQGHLSDPKQKAELTQLVQSSLNL